MTETALIIILSVAILAVCLAGIVIGIYGIVALACEAHAKDSEAVRQLHDAQWRNVQLERQLAAQPVLPLVGRKGRWVS